MHQVAGIFGLVIFHFRPKSIAFQSKGYYSTIIWGAAKFLHFLSLGANRPVRRTDGRCQVPVLGGWRI